MSGAIGGRGAAGPQGPAGPAGASATLAVGQVSAQAAADPAVAIVNSGTSSAAVLDFTFDLPKGDKGDTGATGAQGPIGPSGPAPVFGSFAATSLPTGDPPTVAATGDGTSASPLSLTFGIPAGQSGAQGAPPVFGSPLTGQPGTSVELTGVGTNADPIILTIPAGANGSQGPPGDSYLSEVPGTGTTEWTVSFSNARTEATTNYGSNTTLYPCEGSAHVTQSTLAADTTTIDLVWRQQVLASVMAGMTAVSVAQVGTFYKAGTGQQTYTYRTSSSVTVTATAMAQLDASLAGRTLTIEAQYPTRRSSAGVFCGYFSGQDAEPTTVTFTAVIGNDGSWSATSTFGFNAYSMSQATVVAYPVDVVPLVSSAVLS